MNKPLVSVIVPVKNEEKNIAPCLKSIKTQTYSPIEIIVVDNFSTDATKKIARRFTSLVFSKGSERSIQRNHGAHCAKGEFLLFIDADMTLDTHVVADCVQKVSDTSVAGVIIPEKSFGTSFWAQCKKLEKRFYFGVNWIEAARFMRKSTFLSIGGYNEELISGEDWDISQNLGQLGKIERVHSSIHHNEGNLSLIETVKKKFYYAGYIKRYAHQKHNSHNAKNQMGILQRYILFFSQPTKLFQNPIVGLGMLFMKTCEFGAGAIAYIFISQKIFRVEPSDTSRVAQ